MKYLQMVLVALLFVFAFNFAATGSNLVFADDDIEEFYENPGEENEHGENGPFEDIGKTVGWGTIIAMGIAGLIFPIRRLMKWVITNLPGAKNIFIAVSKYLGKYHIFIGIVALALGITHGVAMFLGEGELESEGIIGLGAVVLMVIAGIVGSVLFKHKKVKGLRTAHSSLIAFAILMGCIHIFAS
jgi:hypothetical protein